MINKVILVGRLTKDPQSRMGGETDLSAFSVATSRTWKDNQGQKQEKSEFSNCTAWGALARICNQYLKKGQLVYVEGRLQTDKYEKDGQTRYATKIVVETMKMLGKQTSGGAPGTNEGGAPPQQATVTAPPVEEISIDDIPF